MSSPPPILIGFFLFLSFLSFAFSPAPPLSFSLFLIVTVKTMLWSYTNVVTDAAKAISDDPFLILFLEP